MRRREFLTLLGGAAALPFAAQAQDAGRTYRLGIMTGGPREAPRIAAFFDELKVFGFIEGKNVTVVAGGFDLHNNQFADYARPLVNSAPDVIVSAGDVATRAAKETTLTIPIVGLSPDMVAAGLVPTFARPGGNVTGISVQLELDGKRLDLLIEAIPSARRIALLAARPSHSRRSLKCLKALRVPTVLKPRSSMLRRRQRSHRRWTRPRHLGLMHLTCWGANVLFQSPCGHRPGSGSTPAHDLRMARNGRRGRLDRVWTKSSADVATGGALGCKGIPRREACRHSGRATDQVRIGDQP
jgi:ABC transporter substrate binding protein